jgi:centromere protein F
LQNSVVPGSSPVPSAAEKRSSAGQNKTSGKRQRSGGVWDSGGGSTPSTPETFSKKSKKAVKSGFHSAGDKEDTEFEPEGLPEVVKKGMHNFKTKIVGLRV